MLKRLPCLCLLAAFLFSASALAEAPALAKDDAALLALFYPGEAIEAMDDFCYTTEPMPQGHTGEDYRTRYQVKEIKRFGDQALIVIEKRSNVHSEGFHCHAFGIYDMRTGALAGPPLFFQADEGDYYLGYRDGRVSILYAGSTSGQGWESARGGIWAWDGGAWQLAWPQDMTYLGEAYEDYWADRKATVAHEEPRGALVIFQRVIDGRGEDIVPEYHWEWETYIDTY